MLVFRNEVNFRQVRIYLLSSIVLSVLMPLSSYRINVDFSKNNTFVQSVFNGKSVQEQSESTLITPINNSLLGSREKELLHQTSIKWRKLFLTLYFIASIVLLLRIGIQIIVLSIQYLNSKKVKQGRYTFIYNNRFKNVFSFFNWIYINTDFVLNKDSENIILHEKIHASHYHSIDLIMIELLAAVMWFNPLVWLMRKEIQLVHEYIADEGALSTGIDKLRYQALLLNQINEERLISLSSSFNHSLIKKRMIMMTKSKFNHKTKLKILALLPLAIVLFTGVACINSQNKHHVVAAVAPVKMNVLYVGVDNPIRIAASGYETSELNVSIDNGTITGKNGKYIVRPNMQGNANVIVVNNKGKVIYKTDFRVKTVPDPLAKICGRRGGAIEKEFLLEIDEVVIELDNFDFDMKWEITEFTISISPNGYIKEYKSNSSRITEDQKKLIKELNSGGMVIFGDIKCKGPDGMIRDLGAIPFIIK